MVTTRLDMRWDKSIKAKAEKASALRGQNLTAYIVNLVNEDATRVIAQHENIIVKDDIFDRFMDACAEARQPNKALREAVTFTRNKGIK